MHRNVRHGLRSNVMVLDKIDSDSCAFVGVQNCHCSVNTELLDGNDGLQRTRVRCVMRGKFSKSITFEHTF